MKKGLAALAAASIGAASLGFGAVAPAQAADCTGKNEVQDHLVIGDPNGGTNSTVYMSNCAADDISTELSDTATWSGISGAFLGKYPALTLGAGTFAAINQYNSQNIRDCSGDGANPIKMEILNGIVTNCSTQ